jgi:hypothetical protein
MGASAARDFEPRLRIAFPAIAPEDVRPWLTVRRTLQRRSRQPCRLVEMAMFVLVLTVGLYAAWWLGPRIEVSVSGVFEASEAFGFVRPGVAPRHLVGYETSATRAPVDVASR